ncbi:MAG: acyltransferase [Oscillospiraceae bacterium]|nr:acyltransferase [Oscillospiraceae bacterium]MBR3554505.1 acyltransferase [Oscillospiraceae bacterium]
METAVLPAEKKRRISSVEFWRFIFTVMVSLYHFELFFMKKSLFPSGSGAVEFFFVLAGFLLGMGAEKRHLARGGLPAEPKEAAGRAIDYGKNKLKAIVPVVLCWLVLHILVSPGLEGFKGKLEFIMNAEWEVLLLVGTPFGFNGGFAPNIPLWFLTSLIIAGYVYTYLMERHFDLMRFLSPVIGLLGVTFFALKTTTVLDHNILVGCLTAGTLKAFSELALGIALFFLYARLREKKPKLPLRLLLGLVELYVVYRLFTLIIGRPAGLENYKRTLYIMALILFSFLRITPLTKVLDNPVSRLMGKITLAMYVCHYTLITLYFTLLQKVKMDLIVHSKAGSWQSSLFRFLGDTGGFDQRFRAIPMTWKDAVMYLVLLLLCAIVVTLLISLLGKLIRKLRGRKKAKPAAQEEQTAE